ncbi:MAG: ComEC/Rec2 family competence protein [Pontixanthobacter sp.]
MSSSARGFADRIEQFLARAGFDKGPWLVVAFATGIAAWFVLNSPWQWISAIGAALLAAIGAVAAWRGIDGRATLRTAIVGFAVMFALGTVAIWARSASVGAEAIEQPTVTIITASVLERDEQPARDRVRLVLATRDAQTGSARKIRVNVPWEHADAALLEGAIVRLRVRLMPPAGPMLPGGYNFARSAWFDGYAATGSVLGKIEMLKASPSQELLAETQRSLSAHVRSKLDGSSGAIAAALASGDRGGISDADEEAMRDSGLTHLLSISGLHVSAVIAAGYLLAIKLLALSPWLALRVRLPLVAAMIAAGSGIGYTLLTGAEVPTVRSCVGAVLVLIALALGREALSLRMVSVAAMFVLILWPESLVGPSFQMSFAAVLTIVALHNSMPIREFLKPREESWAARSGRRMLMLLVTGLVIEIALMPIVLFHFHRAGVYGAFANMIGIPLTTFASMPFIAGALFLDLFGLGDPIWFLAGKSLDLLIAIAHFTSSRPGAVKLMPEMGPVLFSMFVVGGLWLALWRGPLRLWGLGLSLMTAGIYLMKPAPDILISSDGRHVGVAGEGARLLTLRDSRSDYAKDNLLELAGMRGEPLPMAQWPNADCSRDFCVLQLERADRRWHVLMARSRDRIDERALAAACDMSDIVIADRYLPRSCQPKWLKADRRMLNRTGGLTIHLDNRNITSVAESQGEHGWWKKTEK